MAVKFANNAYSTLSAGITDAATSFDVASVATFPDISGASDYMYLSIIGSSYVEIIKVTGVSGTTLTVVRGQDGTTGTAHDSGDRVELRVTTAMLEDAIADSNADAFKNITDGTNIIVADSTSDTLTITGTGGATVTNTPGTDTITIDAPAAGVSAGFSIAMSIAL
tara:strand:+ start:125 stop:622 length:498 start_codon:yes stop_codon:yes gene_type:complete